MDPIIRCMFPQNLELLRQKRRIYLLNIYLLIRITTIKKQFFCAQQMQMISPKTLLVEDVSL